ncbi:hypothetical protein ACFL51_00685 [Myxococcota bacterium]
MYGLVRKREDILSQQLNAIVTGPLTGVQVAVHESHQWLAEIAALSTQQNKRRVVRVVFQKIIELIESEDCKSADELLQRVEPSALPIEVVLAFLSITVQSAYALPSRRRLYNRVRDHLLATRGQSATAELLVGLEV